MFNVRHPWKSILNWQIFDWFKCLNVFLKFFSLLLTLHQIPWTYFILALIKRDALGAAGHGGCSCACINTKDGPCSWLSRAVFHCHNFFLLVSCHRTFDHLACAWHHFEILSAWNIRGIRFLAFHWSGRFFAFNTFINIGWDQQWVELRSACLKKFIQVDDSGFHFKKVVGGSVLEFCNLSSSWMMLHFAAFL